MNDIPWRPARRAAAALPPPQATNGPPGVTGAGVTCTVRPSSENGSPVLAQSRMPSFSSASLPRRWKSDPYSSYSSGRYPMAVT